ncbi:MAG: flagellar hook-length control protein FliK [Terriglobales bacterium]
MATSVGAAPAPAPNAASAPSTATVASPAAPAPPPSLQAGWQTASAHAALGAQSNREINLAVSTDQLGTVQLRASMQNNVLGATLAAASQDAHRYLTAQLPVLEQTLAARQVQVGNLQLVQPHTGGQGGNAGSSQGQAQPQAPPRAFNSRQAAAVEADRAATDLLPQTLNGGSRLNVRV